MSGSRKNNNDKEMESALGGASRASSSAFGRLQSKYQQWKAESAERKLDKQLNNACDYAVEKINKLSWEVGDLQKSYDYENKDKNIGEKWLEGDKGQFAPLPTYEKAKEIVTHRIEDIEKMIKSVQDTYATHPNMNDKVGKLSSMLEQQKSNAESAIKSIEQPEHRVSPGKK